MTYYRARILISGKLKNVDSNFRLIPGMEAQCEIKSDRRRVITYVLYPLIKALDETAKEP
jgi:HlyD family secretion protein